MKKIKIIIWGLLGMAIGNAVATVLKVESAAINNITALLTLLCSLGLTIGGFIVAWVKSAQMRKSRSLFSRECGFEFAQLYADIIYLPFKQINEKFSFEKSVGYVLALLSFGMSSVYYSDHADAFVVSFGVFLMYVVVSHVKYGKQLIKS